MSGWISYIRIMNDFGQSIIDTFQKYILDLDYGFILRPPSLHSLKKMDRHHAMKEMLKHGLVSLDELYQIQKRDSELIKEDPKVLFQPFQPWFRSVHDMFINRIQQQSLVRNDLYIDRYMHDVSKKYVISFCLFDLNDYKTINFGRKLSWYIERFIVNINSIRHKLPAWLIYLYVDSKISNTTHTYYNTIKSLDVDKLIYIDFDFLSINGSVNKSFEKPLSFALSRYLPLFDKSDNIYALIVRDVDQMMTDLDFQLIKLWAYDKNNTDDLLYQWNRWSGNFLTVLGGGFGSKQKLSKEIFQSVVSTFHDELNSLVNGEGQGFEEFFLAFVYRSKYLKRPDNTVIVYNSGRSWYIQPDMDNEFAVFLG